jgi:hypothetical protein
MKSIPRMLVCLVLTLALVALALLVQSQWPRSLLAVTLYKAHLMALGGWGGYWLDRALFPYDRPHTYLIDDQVDPDKSEPYSQAEQISGVLLTAGTFGSSMLRRSIVVAACLICVGLGA